MIIEEIREELYRHQDLKYRDFQVKLIPGMEPEKMIGVRTPDLRKIAKQMAKREDIGEFLENLPHEFFDENQVHGMHLSYPSSKTTADVYRRWKDFYPSWTTGPRATKCRRKSLKNTGRNSLIP